jgi:predicted lipoprotein with Yx(FWY)xxD motif
MRIHTPRPLRRVSTRAAVAVTGIVTAAAVAAVVVVAAAAPTAGAKSTPAAKPVAHAASATQIGSASKGKLGRVLVNSAGQTLYMFTRDPVGRSDCSGSCATTWLPVLAGAVAAKSGSGVNARLLGLTTRSNGYKQATYNHHPLYRYKNDKTSKTTNGEGAEQDGGFWYALNTVGNEVKPKSSGSCNPTCGNY